MMELNKHKTRAQNINFILKKSLLGQNSIYTF